MTSTRSWAEMLAGIEQRLRATTGEDVAAWNARVRATGLDSAHEVRAWLAERGIDDEAVDRLAETWTANL